MINLVKNIDEANCITHAAKFHADDVFSSVIMNTIVEDMKLVRVISVPETGVENKLIYDIGWGEFDHHQKGGNGERENGIRYAAFGLLWKKFGKEYLNKIGAKAKIIDLAWNKLDEDFVQFIDSMDNGQLDLSVVEIPVVNLSSVIEMFNPAWNEESDYDAGFVRAYEVAEKIWNEKVRSVLHKLDAKELVDIAIEKSANGYVVLDRYMPYQEFIITSENEKAKDILYAIYPSNRGGYGVQAIQKQKGSFENRKPLPEEWAGLKDEELQKVSGVKTARFCHNARFLCTTETLEDAILMAKLAIEK